MEAPIPIQASHSRPHLFRSHSSYSDDIVYSRRNTNRDMPSQPPQRHYGQDGSDTFDSDAPSNGDRAPIDLAREQAGLISCRPMVLYPAHSVPEQLNPPRSYQPSRQDPRVSVSNLLDTTSPTLHARPSITMHDSPTQSTPISPRGRQRTPVEGRLPGVSQLLEGVKDGNLSDPREHRNGTMLPQRDAYHPEIAYSRADRQDLPSLSTSNHQGRIPGHSAGSSMSSAFSEPTSPHSYHGPSYSPSPNPQVLERAHDARARAASHLPYQPREEQPAHTYGSTHHRSHTLPSVHGHPPPPPAPQGSYAHHYPPAGMAPQYASDPFGPLPTPMIHQQPLPHYAPPSGYPYDHRQRIDSAMPYDAYGHPQAYFGAGASQHSFTQRKRRGNLPKEATKIMKDWFHEHTDSPYPSEEEKQELCEKTKLQMSQVNNWFINARRRTPRKEAEKKLGRERGVTETSEDSASDMTGGLYGLCQPPTRPYP